MIRYSLQCERSHGFEAWFRNSATYDAQAQAGEVRCPECGSTQVSKALMAPAVRSGRREPAPRQDRETGGDAGQQSVPEQPSAQSQGEGMMHYAGKMREMLVEMRRHIEANADYVGDKFADEARKIHKGETEQRNIYGEASDDEAESLAEEGVEFGRIPWVNKTDA